MSRRSSCERKLRHLDYLSALQHATGIPHNETVVIYPCQFCQALHCGHSVATQIKIADLQKNLARTEGRIARAIMKLKCAAVLTTQETQRERQRLKDLRGHLESLKARLRNAK